MTAPAAPTYIHATALVIGEAGVLIRGRSGSGKTALALALVGDAVQAGTFAALVGDDRVGLTVADGSLLARPHPRIAGLVAIRGVGVVPVAHEPACMVRLVVDLIDAPAAGAIRPAAEPSCATLLGLAIPRLDLQARDSAPHNAVQTATKLSALGRNPSRNGSNMLAN